MQFRVQQNQSKTLMLSNSLKNLLETVGHLYHCKWDTISFYSQALSGLRRDGVHRLGLKCFPRFQVPVDQSDLNTKYVLSSLLSLRGAEILNFSVKYIRDNKALLIICYCMLNITNFQRNSVSLWSEWPSSKSLKIINTRESVWRERNPHYWSECKLAATLENSVKSESH